jgi:hypothetical protein
MVGQSVHKTAASFDETGKEVLELSIDVLALVWVAIKCVVWFGILVSASMIWKYCIDDFTVWATKKIEESMIGNRGPIAREEGPVLNA